MPGVTFSAKVVAESHLDPRPRRGNVVYQRAYPGQADKRQDRIVDRIALGVAVDNLRCF